MRLTIDSTHFLPQNLLGRGFARLWVLSGRGPTRCRSQREHAWACRQQSRFRAQARANLVGLTRVVALQRDVAPPGPSELAGYARVSLDGRR